MEKFNTKFKRKNPNKNRPYNTRKYYHYKKFTYDNYSSYKKKKSISYINYNYFNEEEEIPYEKEGKTSYKAPSTKESSVDKSINSNSNSGRHSYVKDKENINNRTIDNTNSSFILIENKKEEKGEKKLNIKNSNINSNSNSNSINSNDIIEKSKKDEVIKINLSDNEINSAFYKPKNFKESMIKKNDIHNYYYEGENTVILEIIVKLNNNKNLLFKLRRFDDMFEVIKESCKVNDISESLIPFFAYKIIKAMNSIYGIVNLKLTEDEINYLKKLKKKIYHNYNYNYNYN